MTTVENVSEDEPMHDSCPVYHRCETGKALPLEFCARYRCNTFYLQFPEVERPITYSPFSKNGRSNGKNADGSSKY